jgi:hypothetical protein
MGALIAAGAALIGALIGFATSSRTVRANRQIALDERLFQKRSEVGEAILAAIQLGSKDLDAADDALSKTWPSVDMYSSAELAKCLSNYQTIDLRDARKLPGRDGTEAMGQAARAYDALKHAIRADIHGLSAPRKRRTVRWLSRRIGKRRATRGRRAAIRELLEDDSRSRPASHPTRRDTRRLTRAIDSYDSGDPLKVWRPE